MALRGNLRDFSLPDVFQLVTFSRKTGVLRIEREDGAAGSVWFRDGEVFFASSNWHAEPLGERLVKAHRITPQALKRALEIRSSEPPDGRRLGRILIDEGYITETVLETFVSEQIQDTIFDLMRWEEGEFDFEPMPEVVEEDIGLTVSIENVVMEGSRRLEEWGRIKKKIPSMDVVFKMATAPGEGTFEISLKPVEWQLLLLIDATRSVADLARATGRTDFEVARIIYGLFSAGLLEFATDEEIERNRAERAEREAKLAEIEAERRRKREAEEKAALEREAKLAAEAAKRMAKESSPEPAQPLGQAVEVPVPSGPAEEPEFLGLPTSAPTAEDEAVLEQFMGAVLQAPPAPVSEAPAAAPKAPYVPAEEPAFMSAEHIEETETPLVPVPSVEELLPGFDIGPAPSEIDAIAASFEPAVTAEGQGTVAAEPVLRPESGFEVAPEREPRVETGIEPTAEAVPAVEAPAGVESSAGAGETGSHVTAEAADRDFERDLMALGLGEMPADLLEPLGAEPELPAPSEPMSELAPDWVAFVPGAEPEAQHGAVPGSAGPESHVERETESGLEPGSEALIGFDLPGGQVPTPAPIQDEGPGPITEGEPDFSALLESLDVDAEAATGPEEAASGLSGAASDFDEELLRDEQPVQAGGVISTDAFLEDISMDDLGFSGGLTDELSALTGAERRQPARPQASVNAIPEAGSALRRDARVDKDTVLKIIEGIKGL